MSRCGRSHTTSRVPARKRPRHASACPTSTGAPAYLEIAQSVVDGTFEAGFRWDAPDWSDINNPDTSAVGWINGEGLSAEVATEVEAFIAGLADGSVEPLHRAAQLPGRVGVPRGRRGGDRHADLVHAPVARGHGGSELERVGRPRTADAPRAAEHREAVRPDRGQPRHLARRGVGDDSRRPRGERRGQVDLDEDHLRVHRARFGRGVIDGRTAPTGITRATRPRQGSGCSIRIRWCSSR